MISGFFMNHPKGTSNTQQKTNIRFNKRIFWAHSSPITQKEFFGLTAAPQHKKRHLTRIRRSSYPILITITALYIGLITY